MQSCLTRTSLKVSREILRFVLRSVRKQAKLIRHRVIFLNRASVEKPKTRFVVQCYNLSPVALPLHEGVQVYLQKVSLTAPRSDPKKVEKVEKVETKSHGRSALSHGLIFLKVALCRQGIRIFVLRSGSVWVFSRCL